MTTAETLAKEIAEALRANCRELGKDDYYFIFDNGRAIIRERLESASSAQASKLQLWRGKLCQRILVALAGARIPTPEETYGDNLDWAASDAIRGIHRLSAQLAEAQGKLDRALELLREIVAYGDCHCAETDKASCLYCQAIEIVESTNTQTTAPQGPQPESEPRT